MKEIPLNKTENRLLDRLAAEIDMAHTNLRSAITDMMAEHGLPNGAQVDLAEVIRERKIRFKEEGDAKQQFPHGGTVEGV